MGRFIGRLLIEQNPENGREWYVRAPFAYEIHSGGASGVYRIQVNESFVTDGKLIPRPLWLLVSPFGEYFRAAAIYAVLRCDPDVNCRAANAVFYEALRDCNLSRPRAYLMWLGLTLNCMRLDYRKR
jgi:hypothetical protein